MISMSLSLTLRVLFLCRLGFVRFWEQALGLIRLNVLELWHGVKGGSDQRWRIESTQRAWSWSFRLRFGVC